MASFRKFVVCGMAWMLATAPAAAHGTRSVAVELREIEPGVALLEVRGVRPEDRISASLSAPGPCAAEVLTAEGAAAAVQRVDCGGSLAGATASIEGLGPLVSEAVLLYNLADGRTGNALLTVDAPRFQVPATSSKVGVARSYVSLGIEHILGGWDHLLFLVLLVLQLRSVRAVILAELAFTLSHTVSFTSAALGLVHVVPAATEACIALSLVLLALEVRPGIPTPARRGAGMAFVFGLVHGLGFAGGLSEIGLPDQAVAVALAGVALGVEAGQLLFVTATLAVFGALALSPVRGHLSRIEQVGTVAIGSLCTAWLLDRLYTGILSS
jgi:hypothetical protein